MQARTVRSRSAFMMPDMAGFFFGEVDGGVRKKRILLEVLKVERRSD